MTTLAIVLFSIEILICLSAFVFSVIKIFNKNTSEYFIFLCLGTGAYLLEEVCAFVYAACGHTNPLGDFQVSMIGYLAFIFFLFTASFGVLDKEIIKDDKTKKAHLIALIAPIIVFIIYAFCIYMFIKQGQNLTIIPLSIAVFLIMPASFFAMKHILLKNHNSHFKLTFIFNLILLIEYAISLLYLISFLIFSLEAAQIVGFIGGIVIAALPVLSVKESAKW